jgi:hypothetical protein
MKEIKIIKYLLEEIPIEVDKYYIIIKRDEKYVRYNIIEDSYILIEEEIELTDSIFNKSNIRNQYNGYVDELNEEIIFYSIKTNINFRIYGYGSDIENNKQIYISYKYKLLGSVIESNTQVITILVGRLSDNFVLNVLGNVEYIKFVEIYEKKESGTSFTEVEYLNFDKNTYYILRRNNIYCIANKESQYIYNIKYANKNINGTNILIKNNGNLNMLINSLIPRFYYSTFKSMDYNIDSNNIKYHQIIDGLIIDSTDISILEKDNYIIDSSRNRIIDLSDNLNMILYNDISSNFIIDDLNVMDNVEIANIINLRTSSYEKYIFTIQNYSYLLNNVYILRNVDYMMNNMNVRIKIIIKYNNNELEYKIDGKTLKNSFIKGEQNILIFHNNYDLSSNTIKQYYLTNFNKIIAYYDRIIIEFFDNNNNNSIILEKNETKMDFMDNMNILYTSIEIKNKFYIIKFNGILNTFVSNQILIKLYEYNYYLLKLDTKNDFGSDNIYYIVFKNIFELNKFIILIKENTILNKITNKNIIQNYNFSKILYYNPLLNAFGNYPINSTYITININMDLLNKSLFLFIDNSFEITN